MTTCPKEVPLQRELQLRPELQQRKASVEVHVIGVVHEVLMSLQIQELTLFQ